MSAIKINRARELSSRLLFEALTILKEKGGQAAGRDVANALEKRVVLDEWAKEVYEKSGDVRWRSCLHFFSIDCVKAGFLVKKNGVWYITPEGENALKLGAIGMLDAATTAYRKWKAEGQTADDIVEDASEGDDPEKDQGNVQKDQEAAIDENREAAVEGLKKQIIGKNPYEFQDLVAALLRGMGYYTPFVAPKGKDGGVDIIAYRDPLGAVTPRIKVQVKHRPDTTASVTEVRQLMGLLQKEGDVGLFVSSGGFTTDCKNTARGSHVHVELIDIDQLITLWQEFYPKLSEKDKNILPLVAIYFYAPSGGL
jgi:restriction system protein